MFLSKFFKCKKFKLDPISIFIILIIFLPALIKFLEKFFNKDKSFDSEIKETNSFQTNIVSNNKIKELNNYIISVYDHKKAFLLRNYLMSFNSIKKEDSEILKNKYQSIDSELLKPPFTSLEISDNSKVIKIFLLDFMKKETNNSFKAEEEDYTYLINEVEKIQKAKAKKDILDELKPFISSDELEKWENYYKNLND